MPLDTPVSAAFPLSDFCNTPNAVLHGVCFRRINMRLDKYLKVSRLIKRRTVANEACDAGKIAVNGKPARASYDVKVGDVIEITMGARSVNVRVCEVKDVIRKEDADTMYEAVID